MEGYGPTNKKIGGTQPPLPRFVAKHIARTEHKNRVGNINYRGLLKLGEIT